MEINKKNAAGKCHGYWHDWLNLYKIHYNNENLIGWSNGKTSQCHYVGNKDKKIGYCIRTNFINDGSTLVAQLLFNKSGKLFGERILWKRIE